VIEIISVLVAALLLVSLGLVALVSFADGEKRAAVVGVILAIVTPIPFLAVGILSFPFQQLLAITMLAVTAAAAVSLLFPTGNPHISGNDTPEVRIDERDIMFSRRLLQPGTGRFNEYYTRNPDKKAWDDKFRSRPGLLAKGATQYDPISFHAAAASFDTIEHLRRHVDGEVAAERTDAAPSEVTQFVRAWALKLGAHSVGVTRLQDYHMYSVVGRGSEYGRRVVLEHDYAIALTVEMDKRMLDAGPRGSTVMESAQKYVDSGVIAVQLAEFIRGLGHNARAHIDGSYRVVCPLVARDAGLGEIGRMGLLMTPDLGPRVRIAVVTTDMPLNPDQRDPDDSVRDFCVRCHKCATCCPPLAIPFDDRIEIDGVSRWQINQELCYIYWSHTGTDCARCVSVCPYSHPDRMLHNLVRRGVRRSSLFRSVAIRADRLFYGRKPRPASVPKWTRPRMEKRPENLS
jgi:ferredoxin